MSRAVDMIRDTMSRQTLNQAQLARRVGLSRSYVNDIMRGRVPVSTRAAIRFEYVLGMSASALLTAQVQDELEKARA